MNIFLVSLGCTKNLVDSEAILGVFKGTANFVDSPEESDVIIINTCGFIEDAKKEAIDTILAMLDYQDKRKLIVCGCLAERYYEDLKKLIPEVNLYLTLADYKNLGKILGDYLDLSAIKNRKLDFRNRILSTPIHLAYLKISDGCDNNCSYCAIPLIRGKYQSRPSDDIITEAKALVNKDFKELVLISQDLTNYGADFNNKESLASLLKSIALIEGDFRIRLLYLYPDEITDELIYLIKANKKIIPYFDIPLQHASNKILKAMNRRGTINDLRLLFEKIRKNIPQAILRTTIMLGFPYEEESDFQILETFVKEIRFNHLGTFIYSAEENTKAFNYPLPDAEKSQEYRKRLMEIQKEISYSHLKTFIGKLEEVIIEGYKEDEYCYFGRNYYFAPDDIDGKILVYSQKKLEIGELKQVKILDCDEYNLVGEIYEN